MGATFDIKGQKLTVKGELPNGRFYLEGPRGGSVHFAQSLTDDLYTIRAGRPGACALVDDGGILITLTRKELTK